MIELQNTILGKPLLMKKHFSRLSFLRIKNMTMFMVCLHSPYWSVDI
uniref:Uncharacterized protein n=1 Tax=Brassica campestris TaxID=3711 RepID=A0A3P6B901_BRACM|nr:unnamed protein product [Brassica rapa]